MRRDPAGITPEQRQQIIDEISSGQIDVAAASIKYNIPQMVINRWLNVVPTRTTGNAESPQSTSSATPPSIPNPPPDRPNKPTVSQQRQHIPNLNPTRPKPRVSAGVIMTLSVVVAVLLLLGIAVLTSKDDNTDRVSENGLRANTEVAQNNTNNSMDNGMEDQSVPVSNAESSSDVSSDSDNNSGPAKVDGADDNSGSNNMETTEPTQEDTNLATDEESTATKQSMLDHLYNSRVDFKFDGVPLNEALNQIAVKQGIKIVLDRGALINAGVKSDTPITFSKSGIPLNSALNQLLTVVGLTYKINGDALTITTSRNTSTSKPLSSEKLFEVSQPAVAILVLLDANNEILRQGTGFFISNQGTLITTAGLINHPNATRLLVKAGSNYFGTTTVDQYDHDTDIATVSINGMGNAFPTLQLANDAPRVNSDVSMIGLTDTTSLEATIRDGQITDVGSAAPSQFFLSFATVDSQSGSPILDKTGRVIGIYNHRLGLENNNPTGVSADQIARVLGTAAESVLIQDITATFGDFASPNP